MALLCMPCAPVLQTPREGLTGAAGKHEEKPQDEVQRVLHGRAVPRQ